jgi:hypothetical protein
LKKLSALCFWQRPLKTFANFVYFISALYKRYYVAMVLLKLVAKGVSGCRTVVYVKGRLNPATMGSFKTSQRAHRLKDRVGVSNTKEDKAQKDKDNNDSARKKSKPD